MFLTTLRSRMAHPIISQSSSQCLATSISNSIKITGISRVGRDGRVENDERK